MPFKGIAHVGYVPGERMLGISKLARVVELLARRFQAQERLSRQIVDRLEEQLAPKGAGVVLEAEHLCMSLRGVNVSGSQMVTSTMTGSSATTHDRVRRFSRSPVWSLESDNDRGTP